MASFRDFSALKRNQSCAKVVFIQCECRPDQYREELNWGTEIAETDPRIRGIVPWAPMKNGVGAEAEMAQLARPSRVKGIRRIIQFRADPAFCQRPDFVRGVQPLSTFDLSFDLCINHTQFANTLQLVRQCPHVRFTMNHIAKPNIKHHRLDPWRSQIKALAELSNVWCKVSGLVTEADMQH